jgi:hypothetical protein
MKRNRFSFALSGFLAATLLLAGSQPASAKDDFGKIVQHIETNYHVHRQYRWAMGLAGFTVKFWHIGGVKNFKGAIFENQQFVNTSLDTRFDEVVREAMESGWQPVVQTYDRRGGEHTYIYAQDLGKDMKVLVVNLEPTEAVVLQVKVDPKKLSDFVNEASAGHGHRNQPAPAEDIHQPEEEQTEVAALETDWNGTCLLAFDTDTPTLEQ